MEVAPPGNPNKSRAKQEPETRMRNIYMKIFVIDAVYIFIQETCGLY